MKNIILAGLLIMAITLGMAGCSDGNGGNGQNGQKGSKEPKGPLTHVIFDGEAGGFVPGASVRASSLPFVTVTDEKITIKWNPNDDPEKGSGAFRCIIDLAASAREDLRACSKFYIEWSAESGYGLYFNMSLYFNGSRMLSNYVGFGTAGFDFIEDHPDWASGWGDAVIGTITGFEIFSGMDPGQPSAVGDEIVITKIWFWGEGDFDEDAIDLSQPGKKLDEANPLVTNVYCADPTAVEYEGRLYVYGTRDHQQYLYDKKGNNTYEKINSLVMMSTDDMVNWTYHGIIDTKALAPWIQASWAPSIVSRVEGDGKTHFYLYFSNSGFGVGVLTATSPTGPWTSPLDKSLIDGGHPSVDYKWTPFDPGVVIDDGGVGWLSFGAGNPNNDDYMPGGSHIVKLGADMISLAGPVTKIPAPYHHEASELNYINDTYVYTYNTLWVQSDSTDPNALHLDKVRWQADYPGIPAPTQCSMVYMTTKTPLDPGSWVYRGNYFKNPGDKDHDMGYGNNHTHLHKYEGQYYLFYHHLLLQRRYNVGGGFRSLAVDKINVNETTLEISKAVPTKKGPEQIRNFNPGRNNYFSTLAVSAGLAFEPIDVNGNTFVTSQIDGSWSMVRGVEFKSGAKTLKARVKGKGSIAVKVDSRDSAAIVTINNSGSAWKDVSAALPESITGVKNLFFVFDNGISAHTWTIE